MDICAQSAVLNGAVSVPGSKSHTIRACIFAALGDGTSRIYNPLPSADCLSAVAAVGEIGAEVSCGDGVWTVRGAGIIVHLPSNVVDTGNSGSLLYFFAPVTAAFDGYSIFTGDKSIRTRPVEHMLDALRQLGCDAFVSRPGVNAPPFVVRGPMKAGRVVTSGTLSQYVSGIMMAAPLCSGEFHIELTDPKETPYLRMTADWLESLGVPVSCSPDYRSIRISGHRTYPSFERTIPSDWEAVAFPLVAVLVGGGCLTVENVDCSGSQGDAAIVDVLRKMGGDIDVDEKACTLTARGSKLRGVTVNCSDIPDAVPALAVAACFAAGETRLEDIGVCRHKETDRISIMAQELAKLGADITEGPDFLVIRGRTKDDPLFSLHGAETDCRDDHRAAMALSVGGWGISRGEVTVRHAECCSVSFPGFFDIMNSAGAGFRQIQ